MNLANKSVSEMRGAVNAWRQHDVGRQALTDRSLYDRIEELINEIDRLRRTAGEAGVNR